MAKTQDHMNLLQLCQPFHLYKNSVVDKYREIKTRGAQKRKFAPRTRRGKNQKISKSSLAYKNL
jgi:hypothetical protein